MFFWVVIPVSPIGISMNYNNQMKIRNQESGITTSYTPRVPASGIVMRFEIFTLRSLVERVNKNATRLDQVLHVKRGRPAKASGMGAGRHKMFTASTMLRSTHLGVVHGSVVGESQSHLNTGLEQHQCQLSGQRPVLWKNKFQNFGCKWIEASLKFSIGEVDKIKCLIFMYS